MVAEPVQATLGALRATYDSLSSFVSAQTEKLPDTSKIWDSTPLIYLGGAESGPQTPPSETLLEKIDSRVKLRKYELMCVLATGLGVAGMVLHRRNMISRTSGAKPRRRRTPKLANGARRDVVLVVGSPTEPMTRLLALDFEKRGFIVYLTVFDDKDLKYISSNTITDDINYLDLSGTEDLAPAIAKFSHLLSVEVVPIKGAEPHLLKLSAVVFAPNLYFPLGPVENTATASWDRVFARVSVYTRLLNSGLLDLVRAQQSKVITIVPTIVSCLRLSYHAPETMFQNCIKDLFVTLAKELRPQGISVTQVRLGNLNLTNTRTLPASKSARVSGIAEAEVRSWSPDMQSLYGEQFSKTQTKSNSMGSSIASQGLRGFHHLLFDLIFHTGRSPSVVYYGSGARTYERISSFLPTALMEMFS